MFWHALNPQTEYTIYTSLSSDEVRQVIREKSSPAVRSFRLPPLFTPVREKPFALVSDKEEMKLTLRAPEDFEYGAPIRIRCEPAAEGSAVHVRIGESIIAAYGLLAVLFTVFITFTAYFSPVWDLPFPKWLIYVVIVWAMISIVRGRVKAAIMYRDQADKLLQELLTAPEEVL